MVNKQITVVFPQSDLEARIEKLERLVGIISVPPTFGNDLAELRAAACRVFGVTSKQFHDVSKIDRSWLPRYAFYYVARKLTKHTLTGIGRFVRQDHCTVLNGVRQAAFVMSTEPKYKARVEVLMEQARARLANHPKL